MSLLPNQTTLSPGVFFFLEANGNTLNVSTLNATNISGAIASISSLTASTEFVNYISAGTAFIHDCETSTLFALTLQLDNQVLTATPQELLLNGIPLATTSNLSSIADWSLDPAISTVQMNGNDIDQANNISTNNIRGGNAFFQNLIAYNALFVSAQTSTISTHEIFTDVGNFSTIFSGDINASTVSTTFLNTSTINGVSVDDFKNVSTFQTLTATQYVSTPDIQLSTINGQPITGFTNMSTFSTLFATQFISTPDLEVSTINGQPITGFTNMSTFSTLFATQFVSTPDIRINTINGGAIPVSAQNWSQYPANSLINTNGNAITGGAGGSNLGIGASGNLELNANQIYRQTGRSVYINAYDGGVINNSLIQLSTSSGYRGEIDMIANEGNVLGGKITLTAKGADILGLLYGGVIEITAETGGGFIPSPALTSAIRLSAASILEYSGATNSIGSVAGYGFYHGDVGLNLTAGAPPLAPNDPATVYLYGTNGVLIYSPTYIYGPIRPYSDLTNNPKDLYIESYDNLITKGYVQLRGVSTCTFQGGDTAILGVNRLNFSSIGGAIENVSSINGQPLSFYSVSTISTFSDFHVSSIEASTITVGNAFVSSVEGLSSINGTSIDNYLNISSISSLNEWALYDALSTINFDNGIPNVLQSQTSTLAIKGLSSINGVPIGEFQNISSISSLNEWSLYPALSSITFSGATPAVVQSGGSGNNIAIVGSNIQLIGAFTDAKELLLASTISTAVIQGANDNLFGIGSIPGLKIDAPNVFFSTVQTNITGFINASSIGAFEMRARDIYTSTVQTSSINASSINTSYVNTTAITSLGGFLQVSTVTGVDFVNPNSVNFFVPQVNLTYPGRDGITNASTISTNQVFTDSVIAKNATVSTLSFAQTGAFGLSSLMYVSTAQIPGTGTSTTTYLNTDLSLLQNDLYCQQLRVGYANTGGSALSELIMYGPTVGGTAISLNVGNGDRTFRTQSTINAGNGGYVLDTLLNPPFFSTISGQVNLMAYFPSTIASTIGVSTITKMNPVTQYGRSTLAGGTVNIVFSPPYANSNEYSATATYKDTAGGSPLHINILSVSSFSVNGPAGNSFFWQTIGTV